MSLNRSAITVALLAGIVSLSPQAHAVDPAPLSGQILGQVNNAAGIAQMGATVLLYNRYDELVRRSLTNYDGRFGFDLLAPDTYTVRVTAASFVPALRRNIAVLAGSENLLQIRLATLFSSVELVAPDAARGVLMSEDWKWVLRASQSTRPVLRLRPQVSSSKASTALFSDVNGVVRLSAGGANAFNSAMQQDMGTAFGVEGRMRGGEQVRVSANVGYSPARALPSAGFRTTYVRNRNGLPGPQMSLTVRQIYFPARTGTGNGVGDQGPTLRTASLSALDDLDLGGVFHIEYGFSMDSVALFGRINYLSPFARATYELGEERGAIKIAFASGKQPTELLGRSADGESELNHDLAVLSQLPLISRRDDHATIQRTKTYEAAYQLQRGSRTYEALMYREQLADAIFLMSGDVSFVSASNLLPDLNSRGIVFNLGEYERTGYSAAVTQGLGDLIEFVVAGGRGGVLIADPDQPVSGDSVRGMVRPAQRSWATVRAEGAVPVTGTHLAASYGWTDFGVLTPVRVSLTTNANQQVGWTFQGRQPLPAINGMRMELTAELRNLLAQGYLRMGAEGHQTVLTNSPRAVRGGLSFIF